MNTVSIVSKKEIRLQDLREALSSHWDVSDGGPDCIVVEEAKSRVYIYHPKLESEKPAADLVYLDYSSVDLVKRVIAEIADDPDLMVDNDFGTVLPGDQFVARIRSEKDWEWRC